MMNPGKPERWSRRQLTKGIHGYLQGVKGLERHLSKQALRQFSPQPHSIIRPSPLFTKKKSLSKAHLHLRPGAIRSADELNTVIEASGRLIIPKSFYDRAVERYDGTAGIYREFKLRETEEVTRQIAALSERFFPPPPPSTKAKSRFFTPRSLTPQPISHNPLQNRLNTMLDLIKSAQKVRFRPPAFLV